MNRKRRALTDQLEHKRLPVYTKVISAPEGIVEMFVAGIGNVDEGGDKIMPGAFTQTLKQRTPKGVWAHDWTIPISKTLDAEEVKAGDPRLPEKLQQAEAGGLRIKTQFNLETQRGREAFSDVAFYGDEGEWSIGYVVPKGGSQVDEKTGVRLLKTLELYEYSPVLFGMNPATQTVAAKSRALARKVEPVEGSFEDSQEDLQEAIQAVEGDAYWICIVATFPDSVTYMLSSSWDGPQDLDGETYRRSYTYDEASDTITLGDREDVDVVMQIIADGDDDEGGKSRMRVKSWDGSASRFTDDEWKAACAATRGNPDATVKENYFLPHHDPGETAPNDDGLAAAAGRWNQTQAPDAAKQKAKSHLVGHYHSEGLDVPPSLGGDSGKALAFSGKVADAQAAVSALAIVEAAVPLLRTKEGRVLAKRNEDRIRAAHEQLGSVLGELDQQDSEPKMMRDLLRYQMLRMPGA